MAGKLNELWKKGTGIPLSDDIPEGGIAVDVAGNQMYSRSNAGNIFRVGQNTIGDIPGLDDALNGKENVLGNPAANGYVLTSLISGGRSWKPTTDIAPVWQVNGKVGDVSLSKTDIGLDNVDNTSDLAKPLSTATINALAAKAETSELNALTGRVDTNEGDITNLQNGKENNLGIPGGNNYVLKSSTMGVREWVDAAEFVRIESVNGKIGTVVLKTSDVDEDGNLYYTDARADSRVQAAIQDTNVSSTTMYSSEKIEAIVQGALNYKGSWDPVTNTPNISDATGTTGDFYKATEDGARDLGSGTIQFREGDDVIHDGSIFERFGSNESVSSVNGKVGEVVLNSDDIDEGSSNLYHTNARVDARLHNVIDDNSTVSNYTWSSTKIDSAISGAVGDIDFPVISVNSKTGVIILTPGDIGAAAASHTHTIAQVTGLQTALDLKMEQSDLDLALEIGTY